MRNSEATSDCYHRTCSSTLSNEQSRHLILCCPDPPVAPTTSSPALTAVDTNLTSASAAERPATSREARALPNQRFRAPSQTSTEEGRHRPAQLQYDKTKRTHTYIVNDNRLIQLLA